MNAKQLAAEKAVSYVREGMTLGLGTGSTAYFAIRAIGEMAKKGLSITAVASSLHSEELAKEAGIPIVSFSEIKEIDLYIDGADEADRDLNLIKGGGGALLREKILAFNSKNFIVIVDSSKLVEKLGKFPLPVEVTPFAIELTKKQLEKLNGTGIIRQKNGEPFVTDNGNLIIDCGFTEITDIDTLSRSIHSIPGVVETGLFPKSMVNTVIVGYETGEVREFLTTGTS